MKKSNLTRKLSEIDDFEDPRVELEQYQTPPQLAADIAYNAYMQGNEKVIDLGTGNGIIAIGEALLGLEVTAVEIDRKALEKAKEKLKQAETFTDAELIEMRTKQLEESKKYHLESIAKTKVVRAKLEEFLAKAIEFKVPTPEHEGLRKFMIEQLQLTIDFDGKTNYHDEALPEIQMELKNIDANQIRFSMIADANKDITYHLKNHKEELKRCADSNAWVEKLLSSLACV